MLLLNKQSCYQKKKYRMYPLQKFYHLYIGVQKSVIAKIIYSLNLRRNISILN